MALFYVGISNLAAKPQPPVKDKVLEKELLPPPKTTEPAYIKITSEKDKSLEDRASPKSTKNSSTHPPKK
jgi:hypothetical protein